MAITRFNAKNGLSVGTGSIGVVDSEGNVEAKNVGVTGSITPDASGLYDIGSPTKVWRNLYVSNISGSLTGSNVTAGQVVVAGTGGVLSGSNNFWWDNTNSRVGIGTSAPQKPLEVISTASDFVSVGVRQLTLNQWTGIHFGYRESNNSFRKSAIVFERTDNPTAAGKIHILNASTATGAANATLSDSRITITDTGNVGIGGTNPTARLTVTGSTADNTADSLHVLNSSNASMLYVRNDGLVGVGTSSSTARFQVQGSTTATTPTMIVREGVASPTGGAGTFDVQNSAGSSLLFVSGSGQVGIGNSSPYLTYKLDVAGSSTFGVTKRVFINVDTSATGELPAGGTIASNSSNNIFMIPSADGGTSGAKAGLAYFSTGTGWLSATEIANVSSGYGTLLLMKSGGSVGIGTATPAAMLTVSGTIVTKYNNGLEGYIAAGTYSAGTAGFYPFSNLAVSLGYGSNDTIVKYGAGNNSFIVLHGSTPSFSVNGSDNVSIGPSSYTARLFVSGSSTTSTPTMVVREGVVSPTGGAGTFDVQNSSGTSILFVTGSGLVGIGTTIPVQNGTGLTIYQSSNSQLWLQNSSGYSRLVANSTDLYIDNNVAGSAGNIIFRRGSGTTESARIDSSGNVGIGTTNPASPLQVYRSTTGTALMLQHGVISGFADLELSFNAANTSTSTNDAYIDLISNNGTATDFIVATRSNIALSFRTSQSERMRIDSSGNVGINTTSMSLKLEVSGSDAKIHDVRVGRGPGSFNTNTVVGNNALNANTVGTFNTALGMQALLANQNGVSNVAVGWGSLLSVVSASDNTAVGTSAGYSQTGNANTIFGREAMYGVPGSSGTNNVAIGYRSLYSSTTAASNTAIGYQAGTAITTGGNNFFGGYRAGFAQSVATNNVLLGYEAGINITSGSNQTIVGYQAGTGLTTGDQNTIVGRTAGILLTTEQVNTFIGMNAGRFVKSSANTSVGHDALLGQTAATSTGGNNVGVGYQAGRAINTGSGNVYVGTQAGLLVTDSSNNVFVGYQAGDSITTGADNVIIGAGADLAAATNSNSIVIGSGSVGLGTNTTVLGNSSTTTTYLAGNVGIGTTTYTARLFVSGSSTASTPTMIVREGVASPTDGVGVLNVQNSSGTSLMFVSGSGNIGVGTTTPGFRLTVVQGASGNTAQFTNGANADLLISLTAGVSLITPATGILALGTTSTERMRINSSGNVGIGGTNPQSRLEVTGSTGDNTAAAIHALNASNTSLFYVRNDGNVGIGSSNPAVKLDILGSSTTQMRVLMSGQADTRVISDTGVGIIGTYTSHPLAIRINGTNATFIDTSSNVGIGSTTTVNARLQVSGSSTASTTTMIVREGVASPTGGAEVLDVQNSAGTSLFVVSGSGFVGIGTSNNLVGTKVAIYGATAPDTFTGHILLSSDTASSAINNGGQLNFQMYDGSSYRGSGFIKSAKENGTASNYASYMSFGTRNNGDSVLTERMRIDSTGSIGIGTSVAGGRVFISGSTSTSQPAFVVRAGTAVQSGGTKIVDILDSSGTGLFHVSGSGDVTVGVGNLVIGTLGRGIDFGATTNSSGSLSSEVLDDYERGTWTPGITTGGGSITLNATISRGVYVKIGRMVWIGGTVRSSAVSSPTGICVITGLPFTSDTWNSGQTVYLSFVGEFFSSTGLTAWAHTGGTVFQNSNEIDMFRYTTSAVYSDQVAANWDATCEFAFTFCYNANV